MVEFELPLGFVRLTTKDGQPAIVIRTGSGERTQIVSSDAPYRRALIRQTADKHRGAFRLLDEYDRKGR